LVVGVFFAEQVASVVLQWAGQTYGAVWVRGTLHFLDWVRPFLVGGVIWTLILFAWGYRREAIAKARSGVDFVLHPWLRSRDDDPGQWTPVMPAVLASGSPTDALNREILANHRTMSQGDKDALYAARYGADAARDRQEREIFGATAKEIAAARSVDPLNEIAPIPLTNDEAQLLSELRRFIVLLKVCDEKLTTVTSAMLAWDWQKRVADPTTRVLHRYFLEYVHGRQPQIAELKKLAADAKSRTDVTTISIRIAQYLEHNYAARQRAIGALNAAIKEDLAAYHQTKEWLDSELRCLEQWEAIRLSPAHEHLVPFDRAHFGHRGKLYRQDGE
jgi:hypothetical protein